MHRPDTYALCQHLQQARAVLALLDQSAADAFTHCRPMDAERVSDAAAVLRRLVGDALRIADQIEDGCEVLTVLEFPTA